MSLYTSFTSTAFSEELVSQATPYNLEIGGRVWLVVSYPDPPRAHSCGIEHVNMHAHGAYMQTLDFS